MNREDCPVKQIIEQVAEIIKLSDKIITHLDKIITHCDNCLKDKEAKWQREEKDTHGLT